MKSMTFNIPANAVAARKIIDGAVWHQVKALTIAGHKLAIRIGDQSKSRDQESKYHAMVGEIAKQVGGDLANEEDAKRILISAFRIDTINDPDLKEEWQKFGDLRMGRGLRGEVVLLGAQSREFKTKLASAFIDWLYAFGSDAGVIFTEKFIDPETGEIVVTKREPKREVTC